MVVVMMRDCLRQMFLAGVLFGSGSFLEGETVKVFLLSGQSNMTGRGSLGVMDRPLEEQKGSLWHFVSQPENQAKYRFLSAGPKKSETGWTVRDDVFITTGEWPHFKKGEEGFDAYRKHGPLGPNYGSRGNRGFGPEWPIGHLLGEHYEEKVLLVKVAFGGNSLHGNFRPPSSGGKLGDKYPLMIKALRDALENLPEIVEGATKETKYELAGFFWNQGLSDAAPKVSDEYEENLVNLIKDVRKEFEVPELKVVIGLTGNWGWKPKETLEKWGNGEEDRLKFIENLKKVQDAQLAVAKRPEFKGTVKTAETRDFWRPREEFGGRGTETHWMANGESYWLIGDAMGRAMLE